ncbi:MAG: hypothetical protein FWD31_12725 [Planctomycetaceae bacterium]|nr:hypothetical protein [Planctomycetaceae bacterium]
MRHRRLVFVLNCLAVLCTCHAVGFDKNNDLLLVSAQHALDEYRQEAENLARWCREHGLESHAALTQGYILPIVETQIYIPVIPRKKQPDFLPGEASPEIVHWHNTWMTLRQNLSLKLQELAKLAIREQRVILAMQMIHIALHADPDGEKLRNVLGFEFHDGQWRTEWEIVQLKHGRVNHKRFGWIPARHVARYEEGERYFNGKWISREQDVREHADIHHGWIISTEHYDVQTNHSIEEGVRLSRRLEAFYYVWKQVFIQYTASTSELAQRLEGKKLRFQEPRLKIVLFRDRQEYVATLGKNDPNIALSVGFYDNRSHKCFFYMHDGRSPDSERDMDRTVFHEGTHQLFNCVKPVHFNGHNNFWATEAVAIYMETLRREGDYYVLGDPTDVRVLAAKYRFFRSKFYMPFRNIAKLDMIAFQRSPYLKEMYSQCGGLGYFLMHHDKGGYRDAFVTFLNEIYMGRTTPQTLFDLLGESPDTLDMQYEKMLKAIPAEFDAEDEK